MGQVSAEYRPCVKIALTFHERFIFRFCLYGADSGLTEILFRAFSRVVVAAVTVL